MLLVWAKDKEKDKEIDKENDKIMDYQEILIRLIYGKKGLVIIKPSGYLHNILPKTMRGLSHFLAYMRQLPDLDGELGIAEINEILNVYYNDHQEKIRGKSKADAEDELRKRINNLDAFKQYFLRNWCTVRLNKKYREAVEDISRTVTELKIKSASSWIDRLFASKFQFDGEKDIPSLSPDSYAFLRRKLQELAFRAHSMENTSEIYHFVYALRFYFLLEFNQTFLSCVKNGGKFGELLKLTNYEMWSPSVGRLKKDDPSSNFTHFKINMHILNLYKNSLKKATAEIAEQLKRNCIICVKGGKPVSLNRLTLSNHFSQYLPTRRSWLISARLYCTAYAMGKATVRNLTNMYPTLNSKTA